MQQRQQLLAPERKTMGFPVVYFRFADGIQWLAKNCSCYIFIVDDLLVAMIFVCSLSLAEFQS